MIDELGLDGKLLHTWQDPQGTKFSHVSSAVFHGGKIYVCSADSNYVASLDYKF